MDVPAQSSAKSAARTDPVVTEIVRNGVVAITEEMKIVLTRTAYNMIIYEALDFTVGIFDAKGDTVSIGLGLPTFIRGMSETVKAKLKHFGPENMEPGDILLTNDAYITGSHLNHFTFTVPVFHDRRVDRILLLHGALARCRRYLAGRHHGHLFRGPADADREDLPQG